MVAPDHDALPVMTVRAPGRVNLIGEHTDYTDGLVMPMAIDLGISIAFRPSDDRRVDLVRVATGERATFDLDDLPSRAGTWVDYVVGTAWALLEAGATVRGFRGELTADVPIGAGLSSSAALEVAVAWALGGGQSPLEDGMQVALACQRAENAFVGVACGLMDQFASVMGRDGSALVLDCRSLESREVPLPTAEVAIVAADSGVARRIGASGYATRRHECEAALAAIARLDPAITSLREVTPGLLERLGPSLEPVLVRRARHVITENARVLEVESALGSGDLERVGRALAASHASLRDDFEASTPEIDALVEIATAIPGVFGSRLTGGGFGGSTVTLVSRDALPALIEELPLAYRARTGREGAVREVRPSAGAHLVRAA